MILNLRSACMVYLSVCLKGSQTEFQGAFAVCARMLAAILSPKAAMTPEGGPMKVMPSSFSFAGSLGFSLACLGASYFMLFSSILEL